MRKSNYVLSEQDIESVLEFVAKYTVVDIEQAVILVNRLEMVAEFTKDVNSETNELGITAGQWVFDYLFEKHVCPASSQRSELNFSVLLECTDIEKVNALLSALCHEMIKASETLHGKKFSELAFDVSEKQWAEVA